MPSPYLLLKLVLLEGEHALNIQERLILQYPVVKVVIVVDDSLESLQALYFSKEVQDILYDVPLKIVIINY
uniref:Response regulatory domain-containing protein n=1 Tax=Caenorhabditis tropicalis TaxID=1561998 RepID=A0A1I7TV01_9PELO